MAKEDNLLKGNPSTQFTSENQPEGRGRKKGSRAWKDVLADMMPEDGFLTFDKVLVMAEDENGNWRPTGEVIAKGRVKMATQEMIVMAAVKQALKGKVDAIKMIMERMDGKAEQRVSMSATIDGIYSELTEDQIQERIENLKSGN